MPKIVKLRQQILVGQFILSWQATVWMLAHQQLLSLLAFWVKVTVTSTLIYIMTCDFSEF